MQWNDLERLDTLIQETAAQGACVESIGVSGEGRSIHGITIGQQHTRTLMIAAGFHADEVIGPLVAVSLLQRLVRLPLLNVRVVIVPVADPDFLHRNANELPTTVSLQDLLKLTHHRDLEGHFMTDAYPECVAIRQWFQQFDRIDAYLSLHSAHLIGPGLFFYVNRTSNPDWLSQIANQVAAVVPAFIPLLSVDPTGLSQHALVPGFFELALSFNGQGSTTPNPGSSLSFVADRFQPQYVGASEMPLAVCPSLMNTSLAEIDRCNREFKQTGQSTYTIQEIPLDNQIHIMQTWIRAVIQRLSD